eukprot:s6464_g1.t1
MAGPHIHAHCSGPRLDTSVLSADDCVAVRGPLPGRPVATPCRTAERSADVPQPGPNQRSSPGPAGGHATAPGANPVDDRDAWLGHTLLEQSVRSVDSLAFFHARTLVETLFEHFGGHGPCGPAVSFDLADTRDPPLVLDGAPPHTQDHTDCSGTVDHAETQPHSGGHLHTLLLEPLLGLPSKPALSEVDTTAFPWPALPPHVAWHEPLRIGSTDLGFSPGSLHSLMTARTTLVSWQQAQTAVPDLDSFDITVIQREMDRLRADTHSACLWAYTDGSFTPAGPSNSAKAGWAVVYLDPATRQISLAWGSMWVLPDWGEDVLSSYVAECYALTAAALIATAVFSHRRVLFLSDCVAALGAAAGTCAYQLAGLPQATSSAHALHGQVCPAGGIFQHVPGHCGILGNEIADRLSKRGAHLRELSCGLVLSEVLWQSWLGWGGRRLAWAAIALRSMLGDPAVPPLNAPLHHDTACHGGLSPQQLLDPFVPPRAFQAARSAEASDSPNSCEAMQADGQPSAVHRLTLGFATYNVLSLGRPTEDRTGPKTDDAGLAYQPARAALLAEQLQRRGVHVAFLQETRADEGLSSVGAFLRYASGAIRGQFGTEIWLRSGYQPLSHPGSVEAAQGFDKSCLVVLASDERRMFVRYTGQNLSILFVGLHGPHRVTERCVTEAWWRDTKNQILKHRRDSLVVLGGDMNAALGSFTSCHVGDVYPEDEDTAGECLHDLARACNLFFPSTFCHCHSGPSHTYVQKNGGQLCRPDFVAIPVEWAHGAVKTFCDVEIQAAHATPDHIAARVEVEASFTTLVAGPKMGRRSIRASDIINPANRQAITSLLTSAPQVDWNISVHAHAAIVASHVQQGLMKLAAKSPARPHHPYLTDDTWQLQREVSTLRRELHRLTDIMRQCDLAAGFQAWSRHITLREAMRVGCRWWLQAHRTRYHLHDALKERCRRLKQACRSDRDAYISELARTISTAPSKAAFSAYHRILAHRRKKPHKLDPLPRICQADGTVCADAQQTARRWREHFSQLEAGQDVTFEYLAEKASRDVPAGSVPHPDTVTDVPSLPDLRRVLAAAKTGKAPGMDSIPAELGRFFSSETAALLYPLLMKVMWVGSEPTGFKGGRAVILYKGRGSTSTCASYRSILLTPGWAKAFHQAMRPAISKVFEQTAPSLQIGGKRGCGTTFGSHVLRAVQRNASKAGHSSYILFADISAAFYSALVQFVAQAGTKPTHADISRALEGLHCPPDVRVDIQRQLTEPSALAQIHATPWLEHMAASISADNWFLLAQDAVPVATARGTRPGSSWADILFGLLLPRILLCRDEHLVQLGCKSRKASLPWDGVYTLDPCAAKDRAVWGFYRGVIGIPREEDQHLTAHACFSLLQLPAPATWLRLSRLSYLGQLVRSGPPEVWAALRVDQPYALLLKDDMRWLYAWCWNTSALGAPDTHWEEWRLIMRDRPLVFKGLCKRAKLLTVHQHSTVAALDGLHRAVSQLEFRGLDMLHGCIITAHGRSRCPAIRYAGSGRRVPQHPLAPPTVVAGCQAVPPLFDFSGGINDGLLASLTERQEASESEVWAILEACIEPLETLRRTVETWRASPPLTEWKLETAENMLLLLDPSVSADTQQPSSEVSQAVTDAIPQWEGLSGIPMTYTGVALDFTLPVPPPQVLDHQYPTSLSVRAASAYATWIEAACDTCVRCALAAATQPVRLNCPSLATSLGPAKECIQYGETEVELSCVEQLVEISQARAIGDALQLLGDGRLLGMKPCLLRTSSCHLVKGGRPLTSVMSDLEQQIHAEGKPVGEQGLDSLSRFREPCPFYVMPRRFELAAAVNRLRTVQMVADSSNGDNTAW